MAHCRQSAYHHQRSNPRHKLPVVKVPEAIRGCPSGLRRATLQSTSLLLQRHGRCWPNSNFRKNDVAIPRPTPMYAASWNGHHLTRLECSDFFFVEHLPITSVERAGNHCGDALIVVSPVTDDLSGAGMRFSVNRCLTDSSQLTTGPRAFSSEVDTGSR